mgnify:CR=1 FL=1
MAKQKQTGISWADETWSPIRGCTGCGSAGPHGERCWAARFAHRQDHLLPGYATRGGWTGRVELIESQVEKPLDWRRPRRIAVGLMGDWMHEALPDDARDRILAVEAVCPQHTFIHLTKRWQRQAEYFRTELRAGPLSGAITDLRSRRGDHGVLQPLPHLEEGDFWYPLPNVILGVSAWDQASADEACGWLLKTPAACQLLCLEPMIEPVDLEHIQVLRDSVPDGFRNRLGQDANFWVVVGGESGPGARPCNVEWIRSVVRQCKQAGVPCYVKQLGARVIDEHTSYGVGAWVNDESDIMGPILRSRNGSDPAEWPEDLRVREFANEAY